MKLISIFVLLIAKLSFAAVSPSAQPIRPIRGVVEKVSTNSMTISSSMGNVTVDLKSPVQFFSRVPSDLSHVSAKSYIGVTTVKQANGKEVASEIHIFPENMRGTNEGSFMMDTPSGSSKNRMTNGTVARSRMTNGTVEKKNGVSSMLVQFKGGEQNVIIPDNVTVTEVVETKERPSQGSSISFIPQKKSDGSITTNRIMVLPSTTK